jgi:hypothetical protein
MKLEELDAVMEVDEGTEEGAEELPDSKPDEASKSKHHRGHNHKPHGRTGHKK